MGRRCCIPDCRSKARRGRPDDLPLFTLPVISKRLGDPTEEKITSLRRQQWLSKVKDPSIRNIYVCSLHFVKGRPCYYRDFTHVDWVPSLLLGNKPNNTTRNQSDSEIDELGCQLFKTRTIRQENPERNISTESAEPLKIEIRKDVASTITRKRRGKKRKRLNAPPKRSQSKKSSSTLKKVDDNDFHFVAIENEQSNSTDTASENEDVLAVCTDPQPCCTNQDCLNEKKLLQSQLDGAQEQIAILRAQLEENAQTLCAYLNADGGSNKIVVIKTEKE